MSVNRESTVRKIMSVVTRLPIRELSWSWCVKFLLKTVYKSLFRILVPRAAILLVSAADSSGNRNGQKIKDWYMRSNRIVSEVEAFSSPEPIGFRRAVGTLMRGFSNNGQRRVVITGKIFA